MKMVIFYSYVSHYQRVGKLPSWHIRHDTGNQLRKAEAHVAAVGISGATSGDVG